MIIAAGLTPAWQQMLVLDSLRAGEVNRAREAYWTASGKVVNVGLALHFLGGPSQTLSMAGGASGRSIQDEFAALGVDCRWIPTRNRTRVCTTLIARDTGQATELVENARPIQRDEIDLYLDEYEAAARQATLVVMSGSLPPGTPASFYRKLLERTPDATRAIIDGRGPELLEALRMKPFLVKPNRLELAATLERPVDTAADTVGGIEALHAQGAQHVLVTDGQRPAWFSAGEGCHQLRPLSVEAVNPIASGDCLAAGTAWALARGMPVLEAVRFGMAAAAENARMMLPARLSARRVQARMHEVVLETCERQPAAGDAREEGGEEGGEEGATGEPS